MMKRKGLSASSIQFILFLTSEYLNSGTLLQANEIVKVIAILKKCIQIDCCLAGYYNQPQVHCNLLLLFFTKIIPTLD